MKEEKSFAVYGFPNFNLNEDLKDIQFMISLHFNNYIANTTKLKEEYFSNKLIENDCLNSNVIELNEKNIYHLILELNEFINDHINFVDNYDVTSFLEMTLFGYFYCKDEYCINQEFVLSVFDKHFKNQSKNNKIRFVNNHLEELIKIGYLKIIDEIISYDMRDNTLYWIPSWYEQMEQISEKTDFKLIDIISYQALRCLEDKTLKTFFNNMKYLTRSDVCHILRKGNKFKNMKDEINNDFNRFKALKEIIDTM